MRGIIDDIGKNIPSEVIENLKNGFDFNFDFFGTDLLPGTMFAIIAVSVVVVLGLYLLINKIKIKNRIKKLKTK